MFNNLISDFNRQMLRNHLINNQFENSSSLFYSDDENNNQLEYEQSLYYTLNGIKTRIVWVTNYINNEDFPIHVSIDDPLRHHLDNTSSNIIEQESLLKKIPTLDLSKLNLDDLLLLLYRLQQKTRKNFVRTSPSTMSSSSSSSSDFIERKPLFHSISPTLSHAVQSSLSMLNENPLNSHSISRRQSSFTLSNIADVPKQLTTTLAKPISSFHYQNTKHIQSPNDVVNKLLQTFNIQKNNQLFQQSSPNYTYQESQQHKAKLISNLLSSNFIRKSNQNFYH